MSCKELVRTRWFLVFLAITLSYCCSSVVSGAIPAFVALGVLPQVWMPVFSSIGSIFAAMAVVISRLLEGKSPYRIILICCIYDVVLSLCSLLVAATHVLPLTVALCIYILLMSLTPIVTAIAQQIFSGGLSIHDRDDATLFNMLSFSVLPFLSRAVSSSVGSLVAGWSLSGIIGLNLGISCLSLLASIRAHRRALAASQQHAAQENAPTAQRPRTTLATFLTILRQGLRLSIASPFVVAFLYISIEPFLMYVPVWAASQTAYKSQIVALFSFCAGIGSSLGPLAYYLLRKRTGYQSHAQRGLNTLLVAEVLLLGVLGLGNMHSQWLTAACVLLVGLMNGAAAYLSLVAISARQEIFAHKHYFTLMVGVVYSSFSILLMGSSWAGYWLDVAGHPIRGLIPAIMMALLLIWAISRNDFQRVKQATAE